MRNNRVKEMTIYAMFIAIIAIMSFTPIGYIPVAGVSVTIIPVVVLILAFLFYVKGGVIGGLSFGIFSFIRAWAAPNSFFDFIFRNPLVSVVPRLLFGLIAGLAAIYLRKTFRDEKAKHIVGVTITSAALVFVHTALVLPLMYLFGPSVPELVDYFSDPSNTFIAVFTGTMVANGFLEMLAGAVLTPPIYYSLVRAGVVSRRPKTIKKYSKEVIRMNKFNLEKYKEEIIKNLVSWLQIDSVYDEKTSSKSVPFGKGVADSLNFIAKLAKEDGFAVQNYDGYVTEITYGNDEELVMVLGHADVVPEGTGWTHPPFEAKIVDNKIYARGASDDKGPTMAAYYALKMIKDNNIPLKRSIRLVVGGNEERGSSCLDYYFNTLKKPHPTYGFTPDASFPLIFGEKGIMTYVYEGKYEDEVILSLEGGLVANSVPESAKVVLKTTNDLSKQYASFLTSNGLEGQYLKKNSEIELVLKGKAAHGSTPEHGINALVYLLKFVAQNTESKFAKHFAEIFDSYHGENLGIAFETELMGKLTVNVGVGQYLNNEYVFILNIRYPKGIDVSSLLDNLYSKAMHSGKLVNDSKPLFVDPSSPFVQVLLNSYQKVSKDYESRPFTIGGGTYARQTINTVAYGMDFPKSTRGSGSIHSPDETLHLDDLYDGIAVYYDALIALANL